VADIDIAIIGDGPAGLSAAVNALARNKTVVVFGRGRESSALFRAEKISNHLGMPDVNGAEMAAAFSAHAEAKGVFADKRRVTQIIKTSGGFAISAGGDVVESKAVILAVGARRSAKIAGEEKFLGLGVSYCATCDAMLYKGKDVFVYGEGEEADGDVKLLSEVCASVAYLRKDSGAVRFGENVRLLSGEAAEVVGDEFVTGVVVSGETLRVAGAFFIKEHMPPENLMPGLLTEKNAIAVNRLMETSVPGVYACGDATGWPFQISKAIGEGLVAAQQAARRLQPPAPGRLKSAKRAK
jgi:thioredoxin reductase (NADPH)